MKTRNTKSGKADAFTKKIRRLFSLIPLIHQNQGISLEELRELAGYAGRQELQKDLDQLMFVGKAPFTPMDFVSIAIESGHVYLDFPQGLEQPLDLSSEEWLALSKFIWWELQFQKSGEAGKDSLRDILRKITSIPVGISEADLLLGRRSILREALAEESQIEFLYKSLSSREPELRRVDPWAIFEKGSQGYLIGHCHTRQDVRIFSLLRMDDPEILDLPLEHPCPPDLRSLIQGSPIFQEPARGTGVCLGLAPELRRIGRVLFAGGKWQKRDELSVRLRPMLPEGWLWAQIRVPSILWLEEVLLGLGPKAVVLAPAFLRERLCERLLQIRTEARAEP